MKKIIVLAVLGVLGFAGSFISTTLMRSKSPAPKAEPAPVEKVAIDDQAAEVPASRFSMKERQLNETVQQLLEQQEACRQRQAALDQQDKRQQMTREMLDKQAQELETKRLQLASQMAAIKAEQAKLQQTQTLIAQQEKVNLKKTAAIYEKMDASSSSKIIEGMCTNNQSDDAVKILHFMSDRAAAKLLGEIQDKTLAARLCEKLKTVSEG